MLNVILKWFEDPDEVRRFDKGKFVIVRLGSMTIGRASYEPGSKWSKHVSPLAGTSVCEVEHVGMVVSGRAMVAFADGTEIEMTPGQLFHIPPVAHDSWVVGDDPMYRSISSEPIITPNSSNDPPKVAPLGFVLSRGFTHRGPSSCLFGKRADKTPAE